jgi:hypothetical protein
MSSIALPSQPPVSGFTFTPLDFGGDISPSLGGPVQRINRLGNRYQLALAFPPVKSGAQAMLWTTRLEQAKAAGVLYPVPLDGFATGSPGSPVVANATTGGTSVYLGGLTPGYALIVGQWLSLIHAGRRYLHRVTAAATADGTGHVTLSITPMLRTALSIGDVVEIAAPMIEGLIVGAIEWQAMLEPYTTFAVTIAESE